jgi:nitrogen fixation NifU-like protein
VTDPLYQAAILSEARAKRRSGRLAAPDATATVDNPLCGDRVTVDVAMTDGRVSDFAQRVRGCVLCEAAGSIIGAHAIGATPDALRAAAAAAAAVVAGRAPSADSWPELAFFAPVHAHKSRHNCVLLPFQALEDALAKLI